MLSLTCLEAFPINKTNNRSQKWGVLSIYIGSAGKDFGFQIFK